MSVPPEMAAAMRAEAERLRKSASELYAEADGDPLTWQHTIAVRNTAIAATLDDWARWPRSSPTRPGRYLWRESADDAWRERAVWILYGTCLYDAETRARVETVGGEWGERVGDLP